MIYSRFLYLALLVFSVSYTGCSKEPTSSGFPNITHNDPKVSFADFIGSDNCQACHADICEQWKGSSHAQAGGPASRENVIAPFNGKPIVLNDATIYPEAVSYTHLTLPTIPLV